MRFMATLGALFIALVALLGGLVFWVAACATIVLPVLEHSPIRFLPKEGLFGFFFFGITAFAGTLLIVGAHEVVGWVIERAFAEERLPERQTPAPLEVVQGGKASPPSA
ncbi:hypothetical protein HYW17_02740 [Candidatus Uhrbacteria bacterium]|nr:hypothetical protein [Candidatus Uhrbacteria bacterium]